jgi:Holliday junction resolvasome RuvABC DNA-binding subunit
VTLCGAHHRAVHEGKLVIEGQVTTGVSFKHADGSDYGAVMDVAALAVDAQTKAFQALRHLGFTEREARQALSDTLTDVASAADTEARLRAALAALTAGAFRSAS